MPAEITVSELVEARNKFRASVAESMSRHLSKFRECTKGVAIIGDVDVRIISLKSGFPRVVIDQVVVAVEFSVDWSGELEK